MVNCLKLNRICRFLCSDLLSNCILTSQNCSLLLHQKIALALTSAHANSFKNLLSFLINFKALESPLMLRCQFPHLSPYFFLSRYRLRAGFLEDKKPVHHSHTSGKCTSLFETGLILPTAACIQKAQLSLQFVTALLLCLEAQLLMSFFTFKFSLILLNYEKH